MSGLRIRLTAFVLLFIGLAAGVALSMPPSPDVVQDYRDRGQIDVLQKKIAQMRSGGANQLAPLHLQLHNYAALSSDTARLRVLVILVDFSDNPADSGQVSGATAQDFYDVLFSRGNPLHRSLTDFYLENSYGNLIIEGQVVGWYRMPLTYREYHGGQYGLQHTTPNAQTMVRDACIAADPDVDFSLYDNDGDGTVEGIFVIHAGPGAEEISAPGDTNHIWSHAWQIGGGYESDDGVVVTRYSTEPEESSGMISDIGVFCHEFGHTLGLPDLYDVSYESSGIGDWGLMGGGSWNGGGRNPADFCAWSKHELDSLYGTFGQTIEVTSNLTDVVLGPASTDSVRYRVMLPTASGLEYFLIENRQQIGSDASLPGSGLMIWHCDDNIHGSNDLQSNEFLRIVPEQADGDFDLENNVNQGDQYDPFPGPMLDHIEFSDRTNPTTASNYGANNRISVWGIEYNPDTREITCNIDVNYSRANLQFTDINFDDATYGNGDGILDPGEKIEVVFNLENLWLDADQVTVEMSSPVTTLLMGQNQITFPAVARGETYSNESQPFDFTIDPNVDPVNARFDFSFSTATPLAAPDSVVYRFLGGTDVLLVDDDDDSQVEGRPDWSGFYKDALDSLFVPYAYWDVKESGTPGASELGYHFIVWYTGNTRPDELSSEEVAFLRDYLDAGGKLFLTGQDIAQQLSATADSTFLRDYLKIGFVNSFQDLDAYGIDGNVFSDGLRLRILGKDGAANQGSVDEIEILSGAAEPAFTYMTGGGVAGSIYSDPSGYRTVFFGFGFEGICSNRTGYDTRLEVMDRVLDFLRGSTATAVEDGDQITLPSDFALAQNYPNPFNPSTVISYTLAGDQAGQPVTLDVFNILGQRIERLVQGPAVPGRYSVEFDGENLPSGVYFYRIQVGEKMATRKMVLTK